jgi:integrase/recombinase XerC
VDGLYYVVISYGRVLGLALSCHKLRHSAITTALDLRQGDVRRVQKLSRHADLRTLQVYDDARADFQGQVTDLLSEVL